MIAFIFDLIIILAAIFFLLPLFVAKNYTIEKKVEINLPRQGVFEFIRKLNNQALYNKWVMADPGMKKTLTGIDGSEGFSLAWDSAMKNVGKGEQEITRINEGTGIYTTVRFEKPFKNTATAAMVSESVSPDKTLVVWTMNGANKYPMNIINLFIPNMLGKDMSESLSNLKALLEKQS